VLLVPPGVGNDNRGSGAKNSSCPSPRQAKHAEGRAVREWAHGVIASSPISGGKTDGKKTQDLTAAGVSTLTYEGNMADPREYDEPRTLARIESFMETLGLKRIVED